MEVDRQLQGAPTEAGADRASVLGQEGLAEEAALRGELRGGAAVVAAGLEGAARFASGAGRHGSFTDL